MSVFEQTAQQEGSFVERLVKEKGEQWKDPEVIAKGKVEADNFIRELQTQIEEMRKDLGQQDYAKTLLTKLQEGKPQPPASGNPDDTGGSKSGDTKLDASELEAFIEQALTKREKQMTSTQRLSETEAKLEEMFGTEAAKVVQSKAQELGMSVARLQEIASESPTAFFTLIGQEQKQQSNTLPKGTLNTSAAFTASSTRNNEFYQKMRREKPSEFWSVKVQRQMLEDRKGLGDKFY